MRLLLMADTHVPRRARDLPAQLWDEVVRADVVIHAGDWVDVALLDALETGAERVVGCWGNNDGPALRAAAAWPAVMSTTCWTPRATGRPAYTRRCA